MVWFADVERFDTDVLAGLVKLSCGGELHDRLSRPDVWRSRGDREDAERQVAEMTKVYDKPPEHINDPELNEIADLLAMPPQAWFGRIGYPGAGMYFDIYAAKSSYFGVVAATDADGTGVRTYRTRDEDPCEALVASLAEWIRPSPEGPIDVTSRQLQTAGGMGLRDIPAHVTRVRQLMRLPVYVIGEFYAERRAMREGDVYRTPNPLLLYCLGDEYQDSGAWAVRVSPLSNDHNIALVPVSIHDVVEALQLLAGELA